ncbi:glycerophosphodiester phosphodiesterase [Tenacibaculum haliotis]|uniref:glycerophosphodiester phosphodiesterase n=1 Tax=Tenacibaculum haliotis TaxID=1888914 RepID=UPI0021AE654E|nr:glycerophosphodiester phosphodiesterase [Tenacibaculum haliotis]MCT4697662.1 glycerophosphodiester phosphodiesterase [Tenacibaculum haliotis]
MNNLKNITLKLLLIAITFSLKSYSQINQNNKMNSKKIVIAHRGASAYLPEHTMEAKAMAYAMNPDYIEQDLVLSKDNVPIVIHDIYLEDVTNVAEVFPDKKRKDNRFYVIDFTFNELQQLQVTERFDPKTGKQFYESRFPKNKGSFKLHSFEQEIELIQGLNYSTGKKIGIYPEIKNPEFHHENGKDIAKITLAVLSDYGYKTKKDNCIFQCFDAKELERVRVELQSDLFLVQLIEFTEETKKLDHFATYADGVGPWYKQILNKKENGEWLFTSLVADAHKLGLKVHPYTFRADQLDEFSSFDEMLQVLFFEANIDGGFTDFPDKMVQFLAKK